MNLLGGIAALGGGTAATGVGAGTLIAAGAVGGAMGSAASQGFGVAAGIQDKFSWKGVAMGALSGAVSAGVGASGAFGNMNAIVGGALRQATGNAITQGMGVATHLQDRFDWTGVAVAGVVGGTSAALGKLVPGGASYSGGQLEKMATFGHMAAVGAGASMAGAAVRSAIEGSSFGDNIIAAIPDAVGATIGNMISQGVQARAAADAERAAEAARGGINVNGGVSNSQDAEEASSIDVMESVRAELRASYMLGLGPSGDRAGGVAAGAIMGAMGGGVSDVSVGGGSEGPGGFGVGELWFDFSNPSVSATQWLATGFYNSDFPAAFDNYFTLDGASVDAMANMFFAESQGVAAGQLHNQMVILGNLTARGSVYAGPVAQGLMGLTPEPAVSNLLGSPGPLSRAFDSGFILAAAQNAPRAVRSADVSRGYVLSNIPQPVQLNGWQRAGAFIDGAGHTISAGLLGFGAVVTAPAAGTGIGVVLPVGLGIGAGFEADNAYTNFKIAWTGQDQRTVGAQLISGSFNISPAHGELAYTGIQLATGVATGATTSRLFTVRTPQGMAYQDFSPQAMSMRADIANGGALYRVGTTGRSAAGEAQFWAPEAPWAPGYASRYGIPPENIAQPDFTIIGSLSTGARFVTRPAPAVSSNVGGALEIVTAPSAVNLRYFGSR
jgi:hypothetical protein